MTLESTVGPASGPDPSVPVGFEPVRELGRGGMGVVWLATERATGRAVVIKRLLAAGNIELQARFQREAEALAALRHRAVLSIVTTGRDAAGPFLVLEYIQGESLDKALKRGPLAIDEVITVLDELADALQVCHAAGITHRDLKPANVLREAPESGGRIVVADFGLAGFAEAEQRLTMTGQLLGTPEYMAPEQIEGRAVGPAADIWGWAATGYALLVGRPPLRGSLMEIQAQMLKGSKAIEPVERLRPETPPWLAELLVEAAAPEPGARPSAAELTGAVRGRRSTGRRQRRRLTRRLTVALTALVILAMAVLGLVALASRPARFSLRRDLHPDSPSVVFTAEADFRLRGIFIDGGPGVVTVKRDRWPELKSAVPASGRWSQTVELADGTNLFVVEAVDSYGRRAGPFRVEVFRDGTPPTIALEPVQDFSEPRLIGELSEDCPVVTLDGRTITVVDRRIDEALEFSTAASPHELILEDRAGLTSRVRVPRHYILGSRPGDSLSFKTLSAIPAIQRGLPARVQVRPGRHQVAVTIKDRLALHGDPGAVLVASVSTPVMDLLGAADVSLRGLRIEQPHSSGPAAIRHRGQRLELEACEGFSAGCDFLVVDARDVSAKPITRLHDCSIERAGLFTIRQSRGALDLSQVQIEDRGSRVEFSESLNRAKIGGAKDVPKVVFKEYGQVLVYGSARATMRDLTIRSYETPALCVRDQAAAEVSRLSIDGWVNRSDGETESSGVRVSIGGHLVLRDSHISAGQYAVVVNSGRLQATSCVFVALGSAVIAGLGELTLTRAVLAGRPDITDHSGWRFEGEVHGPALAIGRKDARTRLDRVRFVSLKGESCCIFEGVRSSNNEPITKSLSVIYAAPRQARVWTGQWPKTGPLVLSYKDCEIDGASRSLTLPQNSSGAPTDGADAPDQPRGD